MNQNDFYSVGERFQKQIEDFESEQATIEKIINSDQ